IGRQRPISRRDGAEHLGVQLDLIQRDTVMDAHIEVLAHRVHLRSSPHLWKGYAPAPSRDMTQEGHSAPTHRGGSSRGQGPPRATGGGGPRGGGGTTPPPPGAPRPPPRGRRRPRRAPAPPPAPPPAAAPPGRAACRATIASNSRRTVSANANPRDPRISPKRPSSSTRSSSSSR